MLPLARDEHLWTLLSLICKVGPLPAPRWVGGTGHAVTVLGRDMKFHKGNLDDTREQLCTVSWPRENPISR